MRFARLGFRPSHHARRRADDRARHAVCRHRDADKQRGERDHQRGDERDETAGSRDARIARIVGTGCVALRDAR